MSNMDYDAIEEEIHHCTVLDFDECLSKKEDISSREENELSGEEELGEED